MTIWFSSDWHDGHDNIIRYANRPFSDVIEMREFMIARHNEYVRPSDHYYNLGDLTMARDNRGDGLAFLTRMNGHKRLIMGNHDHYAMKHYLKHFEKVMAMHRIDRLWFMHVPCHPMNLGSCEALIHGHVHNNPSPPPVVKEWEDNGKPCKRIVPYVNLSVDVTGFRPLSLEEIRQKVKEIRENHRV